MTQLVTWFCEACKNGSKVDLDTTETWPQVFEKVKTEHQRRAPSCQRAGYISFVMTPASTAREPMTTRERAEGIAWLLFEREAISSRDVVPEVVANIDGAIVAALTEQREAHLAILKNAIDQQWENAEDAEEHVKDDELAEQYEHTAQTLENVSKLIRERK